jgi:hypothetical protein
MRVSIVAGLVLIGSLAASLQGAEAQTVYRWCLKGGSSGVISCVFETRAQCMMAGGGTEGYCYENTTAPKGTPRAAEIDPGTVRPAPTRFYRWCFDGTSSGTASCSFDTQAQCLMTKGNSEGHCFQNTAAPPRGTPASIEVAPQLTEAPSAPQTYRWCFRGGSSGAESCAFETQAQCLMNGGGSEGYCYENKAGSRAR